MTNVCNTFCACEMEDVIDHRPIALVSEVINERLVSRTKVNTARGMTVRPVTKLYHLEGVLHNAGPSNVAL